MSFEDIAAKMKARKAKQDAEKGADTPYDLDESYRIRGKMLGVLLRDARLAAVRSIEDCARLLQISPQEIEAWEYGDAVPALPQLELLAFYLDVPVSHFWGSNIVSDAQDNRDAKQPEYITLRNHMIGALLRQAREALGMTLEELSDASGIAVEALQHYELGELAIPMHELVILASDVKQPMTYFLETDSQVGELLAMREAWKNFQELPEDLRDFVSNPVNRGFLHIAQMFSQMPTDRLREVGASIVDITM